LRRTLLPLLLYQCCKKYNWGLKSNDNKDDDNFRSAIAECAACWYLAGVRRFAVKPEGKGSGSHKPDLALSLPDGDIAVEVKSPFNEASEAYDHSAPIAACLDQANKQFRKDAPNILCLVPAMTPRIFETRHFLVKAFNGREETSEKTGQPSFFFGTATSDSPSRCDLRHLDSEALGVRCLLGLEVLVRLDLVLQCQLSIIDESSISHDLIFCRNLLLEIACPKRAKSVAKTKWIR